MAVISIAAAGEPKEEERGEYYCDQCEQDSCDQRSVLMSNSDSLLAAVEKIRTRSVRHTGQVSLRSRLAWFAAKLVGS